MRHAPHACPHLLEAHNVRVRQQAVVDDFSLHILCDLQGRVCTHEVVNGMKASPGDMAVSCSVLIDVQTTCAEVRRAGLTFGPPHEPTLSPLSMNLMATCSLVFLLRQS